MYEIMDKIIDKILHILEFIIAIMTLIVMIGLLGFEVYKMFTVSDYFATATTFLHGVLTIVVGLEFVRMLMDLTPANTLEVIIVALSRSIIVDHNNPISNVVCVICIAGLFAVKKFLITKDDSRKVAGAKEKFEILN